MTSYSSPKHSFLHLLSILPFLFCVATPFTVPVPDSTSSSALIDAPQAGFSMKNSGASTDAREQDAVYDIMKATGNDWALDIPDVCRGRWHGIECMPDDNNIYHVVSLSFGALSDDTAFPTCDPTRSFISKSITKLPHIRTLFFYRCFNSNPQPIPSFLGQLGPSLQTLILRENGHIGPIPNELGNLTHLKVLDLHINHLNGSIPTSLGRVTGLRSLDLSGNKLSGRIPDLNFPSLNILDLNQNHLSGPIPPSIKFSSLLIKLDLSKNWITGPIPEAILGLQDLILLDLGFNRLSGPIPTSFKTMTSLQALILTNNPLFSTTIPNDAFDGMKNLLILVLSNMNLQGSIPTTLGLLPKIRVIHLNNNKLNGSIPVNFGDLQYLSELRLDENRLMGAVPLGKDMVWRMRRKLRLHDNSGLCFKDGGDDMDLFLNLGIDYCSTQKAAQGLTKVVHHLSFLRSIGGYLGVSSSGELHQWSKFMWLVGQLVVGMSLVLCC